MNLKISVVAIFYNSSQYVAKCVESILSQQNVDLELIAVDDCSKDNTLSLLREYAHKDSRVKIIAHSENKGIAAARNSGIAAVTGACFILIDGDDWFADGALEALAVHYTPDVDWVQGGYDIVNESYQKIGERKNRRADYLNRDCVVNNFFQMEFIWTHNRLINNKYKTIAFPLQHVHEDWYWNIAAYPSINRIINLDTTTYYYVSRGKSFSNDSRFSSQYILDGVALIEDMMQMDNNWAAMAQSMTISTILKNLYLGDFTCKFRRTIVSRLIAAKAYPLKIDINSYARFQKLLNKIMVYPDPIRVMIVSLYKAYVRLFNKPI